MENILGISTTSLEDKYRVEALKRYQILDTPPEKSFDNIAKLATQFFNLPVGLITFVDTENVFLKSNIGIEELRNSPRGTSICSMALLTDDVTVLEDIPSTETHYLTDPLLAGEMGFKFYAGAPLITHDGFRIGTICVIGKESRTFSKNEKEMLKSMGRIVMDEIELRLQGLLEAESKLLEAADQVQRNFNSYQMLSKAPIAIGVLTGRELIVELANVKILEVWGKSNEIVGKPLKLALPELEGQPFLKILDEVFTTGVPFFGNQLSVELMRNQSLEEVFFDFAYQPLKNSSGTTISIMIVATEVTEQVKSRKLLELSEKQMEGFVMNSATGMGVYTGRELVVETANQPLLDIWDLTEDQVIGKSLFEIFPDYDSDAFPAALLEIFDTKETISFYEMEIKLVTPLETKHLILDIKYVPIFDDEGEVVSIVATVSDLTELVKSRKSMEQIESFHLTANQVLVKTIEELAAANQEIMGNHQEILDAHDSLINTLGDWPQFEALFDQMMLKISDNLQKTEGNLQVAMESANVGTWHIDIKTMSCKSTGSFKKLFGYHPDEEMTFPNAMEQIHPDYLDRVVDAVNESILRGMPYGMEYPTIGFHDKKLRWLRAFGKTNMNSDGIATHFTGVAFNITEQKLKEKTVN